ncbi:3-hydroxylacyl-ACP dehydratase [Lacimicrobium sp. SS2-24]|uniref:ApeP family dehydratase n=1 Tax=Lacimicrobium sp. SS2-24 TaxID=2005569 RepID=UPI000B4BD9F4|nr:3-hydroxylacyl-ACP dehydratase [Lacimicrobium sp. SS2-24]
MIFNHYSIEQVLAHRAPMILLDKLVNYDTESACCQVTIKSVSPFYQPQSRQVPAYVGIEYMAQAIAAFAGANDLDSERDIKVGFLLGTRKYQTEVQGFTRDQQLDIHVTRLYQEESGLSVFECYIMEQERVLASAKVNVFQPANPEQFITEQA